MNARIVRAISVCTRTLTGTPGAEALLARANAATVGGLRAAGDRLAIHRRFHDAAIHLRHQPQGPVAIALFDLIEQARLDALGTGWLPGMAANLLAHPGADDDGVRWLAFELFAGRPAPGRKAALAAGIREALPRSLAERLSAVGQALGDQETFAAAAAAWARDAAPHLPPSSGTTAAADLFSLPLRSVDRYERKGRYAAPAATSPRHGTDADGSSHTGTESGLERRRPQAVAEDGYRVYTTAHDRVVNAAALASRAELDHFRAKLDAELAPVRSIVARVAKRLMRVLLARQVREWRFDLEEGLVDAARLAPLVASRGTARPFKAETESPFPSTVVTLLIDHSGSMRGRPMQIAALTVEIFARVLERCGVKCEVLGFTTREWDGGEPGRKWAADGYPENPGRLNALEHIIIKAADVPWRRARAGLGLFMRDEILKENIDGEALAWAHRRLLARGEQRRILVVVSDGTPMDEATLAANGYDYLDRHLQAVVDQIESRSPVRLAAIGIGHDVSQFYANATRIARIEDLGPALTQKLVTLLGGDPR